MNSNDKLLQQVIKKSPVCYSLYELSIILSADIYIPELSPLENNLPGSFFKNQPESVNDIASGIIIFGINSLDLALKNEIAPYTDKKLHNKSRQTLAVAILCDSIQKELLIPQLIHTSPKEATNTIIKLFSSDEEFHAKIAPSAVCNNAILGNNIDIGHYVVIEENAIIGDNTKIDYGCYIGKNVKIGNNCHIFPRVSILQNTIIGSNVTIHSGSVIGSDGFGYIKSSSYWKERLHIGGVIIEDNVRIGSNSTIDRAMFGNTLIGSGTKIDNLVHIAHNVHIGKNVVIAAQTGISGSVIIDDNVCIAGQVGIADHAKIGKGVTILAKSGVHGEIKDNEVVAGTPQLPHKQWLKTMVSLPKIAKIYPELLQLIALYKKNNKLL